MAASGSFLPAFSGHTKMPNASYIDRRDETLDRAAVEVNVVMLVDDQMSQPLGRPDGFGVQKRGDTETRCPKVRGVRGAGVDIAVEPVDNAPRGPLCKWVREQHV